MNAQQILNDVSKSSERKEDLMDQFFPAIQAKKKADNNLSQIGMAR